MAVAYIRIGFSCLYAAERTQSTDPRWQSDARLERYPFPHQLDRQVIQHFLPKTPPSDKSTWVSEGAWRKPIMARWLQVSRKIFASEGLYLFALSSRLYGKIVEVTRIQYDSSYRAEVERLRVTHRYPGAEKEMESREVRWKQLLQAFRKSLPR